MFAIGLYWTQYIFCLSPQLMTMCIIFRGVKQSFQGSLSQENTRLLTFPDFVLRWSDLQSPLEILGSEWAITWLFLMTGYRWKYHLSILPKLWVLVEYVRIAKCRQYPSQHAHELCRPPRPPPLRDIQTNQRVLNRCALYGTILFFFHAYSWHKRM